MRRFVSRLALGGLLAWVAVGCAQERDPINRVQPNAVSKHFFIGERLDDPGDDPEFYWRNYVVDASASQSLVGVGSWGHVDRIRWEITQDMLIGRKAYQIADGQDNKGVPKKDWTEREREKGFTKTPNGTIIAAYKIESHFDIRRPINPSTGEELNVIEENTSDRPWQAREYMRVDWSRNLVDNPMWEDIFTGNLFGKLTITPVSYYVQDPNSDDAIHMDEKQGYLDVTNKFSVAPALTDSPFSDFHGQVPTCLVVGLYTGSSTYECDAQEATVRSSFLRIDPDRDFESLENTRATMDVLGNPGGIGGQPERRRRLGGPPGVGPAVRLHRRALQALRLHPQQLEEEPRRSRVHGERRRGSRRHRRSVRGREQEQRLAVRHERGKVHDPVPRSRDQDHRLLGEQGGARRSARPRRRVGQTHGPRRARGPHLLVEPAHERRARVRARGRVPAHRRRRPRPVPRGVLRLDERSRVEADGEFRGMARGSAEGEDARGHVLPQPGARLRSARDVRRDRLQGARRRHPAQLRLLLAVRVARAVGRHRELERRSADGRDHRRVGAQIMGRSATYAAAMQRDIIQIAMGDTKLSDVMDGVPADTYQKKLAGGFAPAQPATPEQLQRRVEAIDLDHLRQAIPARPAEGDKSARVKAEMLEARASVADPRQQSTSQLEFDALAGKLRGSKYEAQLVDSHWLADSIGMSPATKIDDGVLDIASPLRGLDTGRLHAMQDLITQGMHARGVCYLDGEAPAIGSVFMGSLAGWFKNKYEGLSPAERGKAIYKDLWKEAVKGIGLHEIGHSLGMLHQFASSWDAPNYNPQYWQLRTNEGKSTADCGGKPRAGGDSDTCMGPRYLDPETADEQGLAGEARPGILYFANTSTMEYQVERGGETVGLGTYDLHAMKALYGRVLETFDDRDMPLRTQRSFRFKAWTQLQERDLLDEGGLGFSHYTHTARSMKVFDPNRDCRPATDEEMATAGWRVVHGKVCSPPPKDHWTWKDFRSDSLDESDPTFTAPFWHVVDRDGKDRVRWTYRWGVTHNSYFHTNDSDAGADAYEAARVTAQKFDQTYPWNYFRRQNREYYYKRVPAQTTDRYFERMRAYYWQIATDLGRSQRQQLESDDDLRPYVMAEGEIFDMLARAILMPEPGDYYSPARSGEVKSKQPVDSLKLVFDTPRQASLSPDFLDRKDEATWPNRECPRPKRRSAGGSRRSTRRRWSDSAENRTRVRTRWPRSWG